MKTRTAAFVLSLWLVSSMSFAESSTDAPLTVSNPYAGDVQPAQRQTANTAKQNNDKKKHKCKPQQTAQTKEKKQQQEEQPYHETPSQTDMGPSMQYGG